MPGLGRNGPRPYTRRPAKSNAAVTKVMRRPEARPREAPAEGVALFCNVEQELGRGEAAAVAFGEAGRKARQRLCFPSMEEMVPPVNGAKPKPRIEPTWLRARP